MEYLEVARVIKPHGLLGEVGVLMHWDESDVLLHAKSLRLKLASGESDDFEIERIRRSGRGFLLKLSGISSRDGAERLRDARVLIERELLPEASPGEAYLSDLIGRSVYGPDGVLVGRVIEISSYPSVDSLVIERPDGSKVEQPLVDDWVQPLDAATDRVILRTLDGLLGA